MSTKSRILDALGKARESLLDKIGYGPGSEYPLTARLEDWKETEKIKHPGKFKGIITAAELCATFALVIYSWWNIDFISPDGIPTPIPRFKAPPWNYTVWPMERWLLLTATMATAGTVAGYHGSHGMGEILGERSLLKKRDALGQEHSDLERYLIVEDGYLVEALKPYRFHNKVLSKLGLSGLKASIVGNAIIWSDVLMYYYYGRNGAFELDMAQIWNAVGHLFLIPSMLLMMAGRGYAGIEKTDVMGLAANYDYDSSVLDELITLKGLHECQLKYGKNVGIKKIVDFMNHEYRNINIDSKWKDRAIRIRDKSCREYAIDNVLGYLTKKKLLKHIDSLNYDLEYEAKKYIKKVKKKGKRVLRLTDESYELLSVFETFGATGKNGAGFYRYMDKKYNEEHQEQLKKNMDASIINWREKGHQST